MTRRPYLTLVIILLLVAFAAWVDLSKQIIISNPFNGKTLIQRNVPIQLGLDLRGGLQVLLEADLPANTTVSSNDLSTTQQILMNRANALGVSEVVMQSAPPNRIVAQFPGLQNSDQVVAALQETGVLEFVDMGSEHPAEGTVIQTDYRSAAAGPNGIVTLTPTSTAPPPPPQPRHRHADRHRRQHARGDPAPPHPPRLPTIYHTVMAGTSLATVEVTAGSTVGTTGYVINFTLKPDATTAFGDYTGSHIGQTLAIVLDKKVISAPTINAKIDKGSGLSSKATSPPTAPTPWPSNCATVPCPSRSRWWKARPSAPPWALTRSAAACSPASSACWQWSCSCCSTTACPVSSPTWR